MYIRDDIYLCNCCYQFFNVNTRQRVDVPYTEMPAELAMQLMINRATLANKKAKKKHPI
jgi:hypothetical protein